MKGELQGGTRGPQKVVEQTRLRTTVPWAPTRIQFLMGEPLGGFVTG